MPSPYIYENADCTNCSDLQSEPCCPHPLCPRIMNHLGALRCDPAFDAALDDADYCCTYHRPTLLYLRGDIPCPV
jgi:hypothetical protein